MPIAIIAVLVVIALAGVGIFALQSDEPTTTPAESTTAREVEEETSEPTVVTEPEESATPPTVDTESEPIETDTPTIPAVADTTYDDGSYTASASYLTPARVSHDMDVTLTITDDVVTAVSITYDGGAANTSSLKRFDGAYQAAVIGVSLEELSLSRIGGASLTSNAFNEAVSDIRNQAS